MEKPKRQHKTGSVFQRGKTWYIQYYVPGSQRVRECAYTTDRAVAGNLLRRRLGEVAAGKERNTTPAALRSKTCGMA